MLLEGRGVVVTGAGRGLGEAFALALAREGASVVVDDVDLDEAEGVASRIRDAGGRAVASGLSVATWESAGELIQTCIEEFGAIDGLVNNAVAYVYFGPAWKEDGAQLKHAVEVNLLGMLYCGVHAMRHMTEQQRGSIVNVTSGALMGIAGSATYGATKGGIASVTAAWALELQAHGVRANAISPHALTRARRFAAPGSPEPDPPEMIAPLVVYLLSDLSAGITGQVVGLRARELSLMTPQGEVGHAKRDQWTVEKIAATFDQGLRQQLPAVGWEARNRGRAEQPTG